MKNLTLTLFVLFVISISARAQMKEGHIQYSVTIVADDPETESMASMFANSSMDIYFQNPLTRMNLDMGMFIKMTVITDEKSGKVLMLLGGLLGEKAIETTEKEMKETDDEEVSAPEIQYSKETKKIQGYKCSKATITNEDGSTNIYWYTDKIAYNRNGNRIFSHELPGIPLEMISDKAGMTMTWKAILIEDKVNDAANVFSMEVPSGYEITTYEEFMSSGL